MQQIYDSYILFNNPYNYIFVTHYNGIGSQSFMNVKSERCGKRKNGEGKNVERERRGKRRTRKKKGVERERGGSERRGMKNSGKYFS